MALPTFRAAGAKGAGTTGEVEVPAPAGLTVGDLELLIATTIAGGTVTIPAAGGGAWTAVTETPKDVTGGEKLYAWWRVRASGDGNPKVKAGTDHVCAGRMAYTVGTFDESSADPFEVEKAGEETTSDTSFSFAPGNETTDTDRLCIVICSSGVDSNTGQAGTNTANTSLASIALRAELNTLEGGGGGFWIADGTRAAKGTVGTWTQTMEGATPKAYVSIALKPCVAPSFRVKTMTPDTTTGTSAKLTVPAGTLKGDCLVVALHLGRKKTVTGPSGWKEVAKQHFLAIEECCDSLWVLPSWDTAVHGTEWTWTWDGVSDNYSACFFSVEDADSTNPIDAVSNEELKENTPKTTEAKCDKVTPTAANTRIFTVVFNNEGFSVTPATGWTELGDQAGGPEAAYKTRSVVIAAEQAGVTHTIGSSLPVTLQFAIKPQSAAAPKEVPLDAAVGVSTASNLDIHFPTPVPLNAAVAQSTASVLDLEVPKIIPLDPAVAQSSAALKVRAKTTIGLDPAIGQSSASVLDPRAKTIVQLNPATGQSSAAARVHAPTKIDLAPAVAQSVASNLEPKIPRLVPLDPALAVSVASNLDPRARTFVQLNPAVAVSVAANLDPRAKTIVNLNPAVAVSTASTLDPRAKTTINLNPAVAQSTASILDPRARTFVQLNPATGNSGAANLDPRARTFVPLNPAVAVSTTFGRVTIPGAAAPVPLNPAVAQSSTSLRLRVPVSLGLNPATAVSTLTLALSAPTRIDLNPAVAASTASNLDPKVRRIVGLDPATATSTAALRLRAKTTVPLNPAIAVSTTSLVLKAVPAGYLELDPAICISTASLILSIRRLPVTTPRIVPAQTGRIGEDRAPDLVRDRGNGGGSERDYAGTIRRDQPGDIE